MAKNNMEKIKVCIVTPNFFPVWAGPAMRFFRYAPGLDRRGVELNFVTIRREGQTETEEVDGRKVVRLDPPSGAKGDEWFFRAVSRRNWPGADEMRIFQFFEFDPREIDVLIRLWAGGVSRMLVSTMALNLDKKFFRRTRRLYLMLAYRLFNQIVASNGYLMGQFTNELHAPKNKVRVIYNGVDLDRFFPADENIKAKQRKALSLPEDGPIVLFIGGIVTRKGVDILLKAWEQVSPGNPDATLVLVGPEFRDNPLHADFYPIWDKMLADSPVRETIIYREPSMEIEQYYRAADLFVLPTELEGMPNVIPEAMACGLPVCVTPYQGLDDELGRPGKELIYSQRTHEGLVAALEKLLEDALFRATMGDNARRWVQDSMDLRDILDIYSNLYRMLARVDDESRRLK